MEILTSKIDKNIQTLTSQQKAELRKAVKKTVKEYKKTLDLLTNE